MTFRRLSGLAGLATVVLFAASFSLVGRPPGAHASANEILAFLTDVEERLPLATVAGLLAFVCSLVFAAGVYRILREGARDPGWAMAGIVGYVTGTTAYFIASAVVSDADLFSAGAIGLGSVAGYFIWVLGTSLWLMRAEASPRTS